MPWAARKSRAREKNTLAGVAAFVIEDLAIGEAAVVIDDGVDVVVAGPGFDRGRCSSHLLARYGASAADERARDAEQQRLARGDRLRTKR